MACGTCGQRRKAAREAAATAIASKASSPKPSYTVRAPDGTSKSFDNHLDAVIHKRKVNGTLTTS